MTKLVEAPYDAGGGRVFGRRYAIEHLEWQNFARRRTDAELAKMIRGFPEAKETSPLSTLADFLDGTGSLPSKADLAHLIKVGNLWGLSAQNGIPTDADAVWSGVARALRRAGVEHVNDLPEDKQEEL